MHLIMRWLGMGGGGASAAGGAGVGRIAALVDNALLVATTVVGSALSNSAGKRAIESAKAARFSRVSFSFESLRVWRISETASAQGTWAAHTMSQGNQRCKPQAITMAPTATARTPPRARPMAVQGFARVRPSQIGR